MIRVDGFEVVIEGTGGELIQEFMLAAKHLRKSIEKYAGTDNAIRMLDKAYEISKMSLEEAQEALKQRMLTIYLSQMSEEERGRIRKEMENANNHTY